MGWNKFSIRKRWSKKILNNNLTIVLNVLWAKKEKLYPAYVSKHNSKHEKQVILLKPVSAIFDQIFNQMIALQKLWKMIYISRKT